MCNAESQYLHTIHFQNTYLFGQYYDLQNGVIEIYYRCSLFCAILGQKGIGFKSVFRVTDCPEVHSNGYHIRFDAKSGPIGYILPEWIGGNCSEERTMEDLGDESVDDEKGDNGSGASSSGDEFSL